MTIEFFKKWPARQSSLELVKMANVIINQYREEGYVLTVRQLYYQFIARGILKDNNEKSYKNLVKLMSKARDAGLISWTAIEDRNRNMNKFWFREDEEQIIADLPNYIRFDRWERQPCYVEVWVEKEALGNVIQRACNEWLIPNLACKGYVSASEAWRAGKRFEQKIEEGRECHIIHLGDHDPSGIDMTRDNRERVTLYSYAEENEIQVHRIALNYDQVLHYNPPPNPTKLKDTRSKMYLREYGETCWELDALEPKVINNLITETVKPLIDMKSWEEVGRLEEEKEQLLSELGTYWHDLKPMIQDGEIERIIDNWDSIKQHLDDKNEG